MCVLESALYEVSVINKEVEDEVVNFRDRENNLVCI